MRSVICFLIAVFMATSALSERRELTPEDVLQLAAHSVTTGRHEQALALTEALLDRDPKDVGALLVHAHALRALGRLEEARAVAATAWRASDTDAKKFAAARVRAQMLSSSGQRTLSQLWLRRASAVAPTPQDREQVVQDFRYVKSRNPWQVNLSFSATPSSNINNGSRQRTGSVDPLGWGAEFIWALPATNRALSGTEFRSSVALRYRLKDRKQSGYTDLHLATSRQDYRLSDEAKQLAPSVQGSDFAFSSYRVGITHVGRLAGDAATAPQYALSADVTRSLQAGEAYRTASSIGGRFLLPLNERSGLTSHLHLFRQTALTSAAVDRHGWGGGLIYHKSFGQAGHKVSFGLSTQRSFSDHAGSDWQAHGLQMGLHLGQPVLGARLGFALSAEDKRFDQGPITGRGRQDHSVTASLSMEPAHFDLYGFVPRLTLRASRTESDFGQYDTEESGIRFGFRSAF